MFYVPCYTQYFSNNLLKNIKIYENNKKIQQYIKHIKTIYALLCTIKLIMTKFKRKLITILDIIKSDKFFLATFKENNELDW